ncbi:hypothetical protein PENANT_c015G09192 [Penicillium antarcticum]|uniref:FAD-binding PCMH-type domain-containing protein n=1 Tax=Penicillium antarcticum TaxID=416450 RepID=A0A1V6Q3K9_9EURO|nr:uncharacterized protein N7508_004932 [Penicillium antarcticum]KAJ5305917.1 hypothetical protein N7508_004932 [Penicillium antarcticum]OQD83850.1 hypothetical protein PENANT_c015G09192 [Penicillium antarcticum]
MKLFLFSLFATIASAAPSTGHCRCRPHESCWPSEQEWSGLNDTIQGNLVAVRPAASVCYAAEFDQAACKDAINKWSDSTWRAAQPGAGQWENWEAWAERHQTCYMESAHDKTCGQGRISLYSAKVQTASQIQKAVRFASAHNLRLAIKNSGHDFLGRSAAPGSLQILTNGMKDIKFVDNFIPVHAPKGKGEGKAVTLSAGVNLAELYKAVAEHNVTVIAGASHTVGAAGGYIQGGGHSPFGAWKGLASDNALEFEIVTADGKLVTANAYQNSDLFWALRGGGGGTFGVVAKVTVRTFAEVPVVVANLNITTSAGDPHFWNAFTEWHAALPDLNDGGGSGYYFGIPDMSLNATSSVSSIISLLMFPEHSETSAIGKLYAPLVKKLKSIPGVVVQYGAFGLPTMNTTIQTMLLEGNTDTTGGMTTLLSRLYSKDLLLSEDGPSRLSKAWSSLRYSPGETFIGHVVAGGAVAANGDKVDSAVNPAWRKAVIHLLCSRSWNATTTLAKQRAIIKNATEVEIPLIRSVEGNDNMGAYLNEAHPYEPGFQGSFWGDNYPRLYSLKQKWDPKGLFIARKGVGSEDWDDAGLCLSK